jgi:hypothetical protein
VPTTGSVSVTVLGSNAGVADASPVLRAHGSAGEFTVWTSSSAVAAKTSPVSSSGRAVATSAGLQVGTLSSVFTAAGPAVSSLVGTNGPATGAASVTVLGSNAGGVHYSVRDSVGGSVGEATSWMSSSAVAGKLASGIAASRTAVATVGVSTGSLASVFTATGAEVSGVLASNCASTGVSSVTVLGSGTGAADYSALGGRLDGTTAETTVWTSESSLR